MASSQNGEMISIRNLTLLPEMREAVRLQETIWGFNELDLLPVRLFVVATKIGGQLLGAFDGTQMVAFLIALPGLKTSGKAFLHSQMMGVLPEYRNQGVGRLLKVAQREEALERGVDLIEWTFDPLELKNAFFNIERLGAVVRRYVLNQYGKTSSHLHGELPTDRCVAEWPIRSPRVSLTLEGEKPPVTIVRSIGVPNNIEEIRREEPREAKLIQSRISEQFLEAFREGLAVVAFERGAEEAHYKLGPWQSE